MLGNDGSSEKRGPGRPRTAAEIRVKAVQLRRTGHSWTEIAEALAIGRTTARRLCQNGHRDGETPNPPRKEKRIMAQIRRRE